MPIWLVTWRSGLAAQVHHVDLGAAALGQGHRQAAAVGRERRPAVDAAETGDQLARAAGDVLHVDRGIAALEADIGQLAAVRAPCRRQQRLRRTGHALRIETIGVGDHQGITRALPRAACGDVGDAGPERAAHAEDLFVDRIGDLVGDIAHRAGTRRQGEAEQALLLGDIEQFVFDPVAAAAGIEHAADDQKVLLQRQPGRELDLAAAAGALDDVALGQAAELAGAVQVGTDHRGDVGLHRASALVRHRHHRDRQGRGVAADDVDFQPLLLRHGGERDEQDEQGGQPAQRSGHRQVLNGVRN